jgi:predicted house-cleaning noncanonical NTP pyrophosphatase (MazG superfamily)
MNSPHKEGGGAMSEILRESSILIAELSEELIKEASRELSARESEQEELEREHRKAQLVQSANADFLTDAEKERLDKFSTTLDQINKQVRFWQGRLEALKDYKSKKAVYEEL